MAKFNRATAHPTGQGPISGEAAASGRTHEGAAGYARDVKSELFLLAVSSMAGEDTFYESASQRDARFRDLVRTVAVADPEWLTRMLGWLRGEGNLRSAALVGAAEGVKARLEAQAHGGNREMVASVLARADEPGEMLAYWTSRYGRAIPKPVKRGVADVILRLGTEFNYVKWDSEGRGFRFADILNLTHPGDRAGSAQHIRGQWQHDLFGYVVAQPHRDVDIPGSLDVLTRRQALLAMPVDERRQVLESPDVLREAGMTWEALAGWLQGPMDARAWTAVTRSMGYMALLRNLRNFDQAGVGDVVAERVAARLADPEAVARSRQLPMRFLSAYRAVPSLRWVYPLERALGHSLANVPALAGRTLVLVDRSGSMSAPLSARSGLTRADAAAVFGAALASRAQAADLVEFGTSARPVAFTAGESILRVLGRFHDMGGTNTAHAVRSHYDGLHHRVVIVTDEQAWGGPYGEEPTRVVPAAVPVYTWNLAGYRHGHGPTEGNRHTFGGLSDAAFRMIPLIEAGRNADWPF